MNEYTMTTALDLGDKYSVWVTLNAVGEKIDSGRVRTTKKGLRDLLSNQERRRVIIEAGSHSPWVRETVAELGHEVIVADPRRLPLVSENTRKNDRNDAELLARLGRLDLELLAPVQHRGKQAQADLAVLQARDGLVRTRTQLVNQVRGLIKLTGERAPSASPEAFVKKVRPMLGDALRPALEGLLETIDAVNEQIKQYNERIELLCKKRYSETDLLREIAGVGPITALAFILILEDPHRFSSSRDVGPFLGLTPKQDQSGESNPSLHISKAGNAYMRRLLVQAAQYILGPFGPDCDLRRRGLRLAGAVDAKGKHNKRLKKRAVIATARKLSVLLHYLWRHGVVYDPLYQQNQRSAKRLKHDQQKEQVA